MSNAQPKRYLLLGTVEDRVDGALAMLRTAAEFLPGWTPVVVAQEFSDLSKMRMSRALKPMGGQFITLPQRIGPHRAKLRGLQWIIPDAGEGEFVICSVDDDMEFVADTNLEPVVRKALDPLHGLVSSGWVNHESRLPKARDAMQDRFHTQPIVYTGGGLVFSSKVARVLAAMPDVPFFSDNVEWSLAVYLAGYTNCRYRGSLTIHRVCKKGGRRAWVELKERVLSDPELIHIKRGELAGSNGYLIGTSEDLTAKARGMHMTARQRLSGGPTL